jgi:sugar phosphate isomerase/epimerase
MQLGFVSAILPDENFERVLQIASSIGYDCVEIMCWPLGKSTRRYAGVTHIDVNLLNPSKAIEIHELCDKYNVFISGLGYYPNPLVADGAESSMYINHIKKVIDAASILNIPVINTFVGRDHTKSIPENWPRFKSVWTDIIAHATQKDIKVAIENCPMLFTYDEWPGGKNLATSPKTWTQMFADIDSDYFGLNYDPSHMIWQHMDYLAPMRDFTNKLFHIHAKDMRVDRDRLNQVGIMAPPTDWYTPKLPGIGDVNWGNFFSTLSSVGYNGPVCVEVEDRAYEGSLDKRIDSLVQSHQYLRQYIPKKIEV